MKAYNFVFLVFCFLCTSEIICSSNSLKGKNQKQNISASADAQITFNTDLEDALKNFKTVISSSSGSTTASPRISVSASSSKCLDKFKNILDKLPGNIKNILISQFEQNTNPNACCDKASVIQAIAKVFNNNQQNFSDLLTIQSKNSKSALGCFRGVEIAQAQTGGQIDQTAKEGNKNRVKSLIENTNQINSNIAKCLVQLNSIALQNIGMICEDNDFVAKVYDIDSSGIVRGPKKSHENESKIFENCSEYVNNFQRFSETVFNTYIEGVNYLTGLDQCNYFSNFFTFDHKNDQADSLNSKKEITNYTKTELLDKWHTCSQTIHSFSQNVTTSLKENYSKAQLVQPNGLSTYIGRYDIKFDVIKKAFPLSEYPAFQIRCEKLECQAYCDTCNTKIWDNKGVVTSDTTKLDVSCCDKVCIVWLEIKDNINGFSNFIPGAEIFYISGDQFFSDVNKLTVTKIKNTNTCIQNTLSTPAISFVQTAQNDTTSSSTITAIVSTSSLDIPTDRSNSTNISSPRQFSNQVLRQKLQNVADNAQNIVMDGRLNSVLLLKATVDNKTQTLMEFLYGNMYAKNNSFYLECTNGKCKLECDSCGDKNFSLEPNNDSDPANSYKPNPPSQKNALKAKLKSKSTSSVQSGPSTTKSSVKSGSSPISSSDKSGSTLTPPLNSTFTSLSEQSSDFFSQPGSSFGSSSNNFGSSSFNSPSSFSQPGSSFGSSSNNFGSSSFNSPSSFSQPGSSFGSSSNNFGGSSFNSPSSFSQPGSSFGSSSNNFGSSSFNSPNSFSQPGSSFGSSSNNFGGSSFNSLNDFSQPGSSFSSSNNNFGGSSFNSPSSFSQPGSSFPSSNNNFGGSSFNSPNYFSQPGSSFPSSNNNFGGSSFNSPNYFSQPGSSFPSSNNNFGGSSYYPSSSLNDSYDPFLSSSSSSYVSNGTPLISDSFSDNTFGFGSTSSLFPPSLSSHYTPSFSSSSSYSPFSNNMYNPPQLGYYNSNNYVNVYNPYNSYDYLYYNNHYGYGYNGYYSGYNPYYYSPRIDETSYSSQTLFNIKPEFNPSDWVISYNKPFNTNEYVKTLNGLLANVSIYSQCCKLFCVIYIDPIEDGVNTGGAKRVYVNITTKTYAFIDPSTVSFTQKKCLEENLSSSTKSSSLTQCEIKYPYDLIPVKDQCLNLMADQCKSSNFKLLVSRVSANVKSSEVSQNNICTPPLSCVNLAEKPSETEKQTCGASLYSLFLDNGVGYSYSSIASPCTISKIKASGSTSLIASAQTEYVDTNSMSEEQQAKYTETKVLAEKMSNANIQIDGSTSTSIKPNSDQEAATINDAVDKQLDRSVLYYSNGSIFSFCTIIIFLGIMALF